VGPDGTLDNLDAVADAYRIVTDASGKHATAQEIESLADFLTSVAASADAGGDHVSDLVFVLSSVRSALIAAPHARLFEAYRDAARIARRYDPTLEYFVDDELLVSASVALAGIVGGAELIADLVTSHGDQVVAAAMRTEVITNLITENGDEPRRLRQLWMHFGRWLFADGAASSALEPTFRTLDRSAAGDDQAITAETDGLLNALMTACAEGEQALLDAALAYRRQHGGPAAEMIYYRLVATMPLDARRAWRHRVEPEIDDIGMYEIECDVRRAGPDVLRVLEGWAAHLAPLRGDVRHRATVATGCRRALEDASPSTRRDVALSLVKSDPLMECLDGPIEASVLCSAFTDRTLDWALSQPATLASRFAAHPALSPSDGALLEIRMAVDSGRFDARKVAQIRGRFAALEGNAEYAKEIQQLLLVFVSPGVAIDQYGAVVRAAYIREHSQLFWRAHRDAVIHICASLPAPSRLKIPFMGKSADEIDRATNNCASWLFSWLEFWFNVEPNGLLEYPFVAQQFFMELPTTMDALCKCTQWRPVAHLLAQRAARAEWFPIVQRWLA
jgi:hypothetical protein